MEDGLTKEEMELTNRLTARDPSNLTGFQNNQAFRFSERDHKMRDGGVILFTVGFKSQDRADTRQQQGRDKHLGVQCRGLLSPDCVLSVRKSGDSRGRRRELTVMAATLSSCRRLLADLHIRSTGSVAY